VRDDEMNSNKVNLLLIFLLFYAAQNAYALDCKKGGETTVDMKECANKELEEVTKKINETYNAYRKLLDPKQQKDLKAVQLAWIKYKDLRCAFEYSFYEGGTMAGLVGTSCLTNITNQRLKELEADLKDQSSR
jgi:uncharacterized protein YecT (DUF1311 family)